MNEWISPVIERAIKIAVTTCEQIVKKVATAFPQCCGSSVSDPYSFFPDPDPEVEAGGQYGSGSGSNPDPGL